MLNDLLNLLGWGLFFLTSCASKSSLVVKRNLRFLLRGIFGRAKVMKPSKVWESERWWHAHHTSRWVRSNPMGSMDHASRDSLLLLVIWLFFLTLGDLDHVLEIKEATKGIGMCLSLHHSKSLFVVSALTMNRARSDMHLLVFIVFHILLVLHMLIILEVLVLLFHVSELLRRALLLGRWTWALSLLSSSVDVVRFDLEIFLLFIDWTSLACCRASEHAIVPGGRLLPLVRSHVLSTERIHSPSIWLVGMFVVLFWFAILKLALGGSWTFLRSATLDEVVIVAHSWMSVSTSVARRNTSVARKIEQRRAKWRYVCPLMECSRFRFLNALIKNAIHLIGGFWYPSCPIAHVARGLHVGTHFLLVGANVGWATCYFTRRCFSLGIIAIFSNRRSRFLNFLFLVIWDYLTKIFRINSFLTI